jgi:phosphonate transport system substrate-binding protein
MQQLEAQQFDIVFVQPFDYVRIADQYGYKALASRDESLEAVVVVNTDSPYKSIQDLRGKHLATPPSVAAVTYLIEAYLKEQGVDPQKDIKIDHHRSHVSCMQKVLIGTAAACATAVPAVRFFTHKMDVQFNIVGKSSSIPHTLFATHPRMGKENVALLLKEILSWAKSEEGRELLMRGKFKHFRKVVDREYDVVRAFARQLKVSVAK